MTLTDNPYSVADRGKLNPHQADLFAQSDVEKVTLAFWQEREMQFPAFVRRMKPDALDYASGAWALAMLEATK